VDQGTGRTRDDLTPRTKAKLDPVDPITRTAVASEMDERPDCLILCPLAEEYDCVCGELAKFSIRQSFISTQFLSRKNVVFRIGGRRHWVFQSGLGLESARLVEQLIPLIDPEIVCLLGFAGAVDHSCAIGDTVEGFVIWSAESGEYVVPATLGIATRMAQMTTATAIVETPDARASHFKQNGCAAVEMEAFYVGKVCKDHGKFFITARAISDAADETFPNELNGIIKPNGDLSMKRLAWAVLKKPTLVGPLVRLWKNSRKAKEGLRLITRRLVEKLA
jgi:nucleoside phosphorylase